MPFTMLALHLVLVMGTQVGTVPIVADAHVSGRVVDAGSQIPIAGAQVMLMMVPDVSDSTVDPRARQVVTDASGQFAFDAITPGRYQLAIEQPGFARFGAPFDDQTIEVAAGQSVSGIQIDLRKGAVVGGRISDASGKPLSEITVLALKRTDVAGPFGFMMMHAGAQTDASGAFRIADLAEGEYVLIATPHVASPFDGPVTSGGVAMAPTYYPGTNQPEAAQPITLTAGQITTGLEFSLVSLPAFQVSGTVVDESGAPVGGAMVTLMADPRRDASLNEVMAVADKEGTFRMGGVVSGAYVIMAEASTLPRDAGGVAPSSFSTSFAFSIDVSVDDPSQVSLSPEFMSVTVDNADLGNLKVVVHAGK